MFKLIKINITFSRNKISIEEKKFSFLLQQAQEKIKILAPFIRTRKKEKLLTFEF